MLDQIGRLYRAASLSSCAFSLFPSFSPKLFLDLSVLSTYSLSGTLEAAGAATPAVVELGGGPSSSRDVEMLLVLLYPPNASILRLRRTISLTPKFRDFPRPTKPKADEDDLYSSTISIFQHWYLCWYWRRYPLLEEPPFPYIVLHIRWLRFPPLSSSTWLSSPRPVWKKSEKKENRKGIKREEEILHILCKTWTEHRKAANRDENWFRKHHYVSIIEYVCTRRSRGYAAFSKKKGEVSAYHAIRWIWNAAVRSYLCSYLDCTRVERSTKTRMIRRWPLQWQRITKSEFLAFRVQASCCR